MDFGIDYSRGNNPNQGQYGHDHYNYSDLRYTHRQPQNRSINDEAYQQNSRSFDQDNNYDPILGVRDLRGRFCGPNRIPTGHSGPRVRSASVGKRWTRPDPDSTGFIPSGLAQPAWVPGTKRPPKDENARGHYVPRGYVPSERTYSPPVDHASQYPGEPTKYSQNQFSQSTGRHSPTNQRFVSHYEGPAPAAITGGKQAWQGTLRSRDDEPGNIGGGAFYRPEPSRPDVGSQSYQDVQPHQPRVQTMHYTPGQAPQYQQHDPSSSQAEDSDAKVAHLQYNSPLGLYSKENAQAVLVGQTRGKPGEGTMTVTGGGQNKPNDPRQSALAQLVQEQDNPRQPGQRTHSNPGAAQQQAASGYSYYGDIAEPPGVYSNYHNASAAGGFGTSDF